MSRIVKIECGISFRLRETGAAVQRNGEYRIKGF
jgi:hypothetical protein